MGKLPASAPNRVTIGVALLVAVMSIIAIPSVAAPPPAVTTNR